MLSQWSATEHLVKRRQRTIQERKTSKIDDSTTRPPKKRFYFHYPTLNVPVKYTDSKFTKCSSKAFKAQSKPRIWSQTKPWSPINTNNDISPKAWGSFINLHPHFASNVVFWTFNAPISGRSFTFSFTEVILEV